KGGRRAAARQHGDGTPSHRVPSPCRFAACGLAVCPPPSRKRLGLLLPSTCRLRDGIIHPMRILHTADWHLGDRLGRIDRTDDLRRAVERVADYCVRRSVDVLLVAGDLFSELARPDTLREAIRHVQETFRGFLCEGGTIVTLTGNHDNENFCQTL